jgi:hypothetical protein
VDRDRLEQRDLFEVDAALTYEAEAKVAAYLEVRAGMRAFSCGRIDSTRASKPDLPTLASAAPWRFVYGAFSICTCVSVSATWLKPRRR